jgi:hypothetical protein
MSPTSSIIFYEPFYSEIERLLNDSSVLKRTAKQVQDATAHDTHPGQLVRSFKPRSHQIILHFLNSVHEDIYNQISATLL